MKWGPPELRPEFQTAPWLDVKEYVDWMIIGWDADTDARIELMQAQLKLAQAMALASVPGRMR